MSNLDKEFEKEEGICVFDSMKNSEQDFDKIYQCLTETFKDNYKVFVMVESLEIDKASGKGKFDEFCNQLGMEKCNNWLFSSFAHSNDYQDYWKDNRGVKEAQFFVFDELKNPTFFTNELDNNANYKVDKNKKIDIKQKIYVKKIEDNYYIFGKELKTDEIDRQDFRRSCVIAPIVENKNDKGNSDYWKLDETLKDNGFYDMKFNIRECKLYDILPSIPKDQFKSGAVEFAKLYGVTLDNEKDKNVIVNGLKPKQKKIINGKINNFEL